MSKKSKWLWVFIGIIAILAVGLTVYLTQNRSGSTPDGDPSVSNSPSDPANPADPPDPADPAEEEPSPLPTPADLDTTSVDSSVPAEEAAETLVDQLTTVLPQDGVIGDDLQAIADEALADQLQALAYEYADYGWEAIGQVKVLSVDVVETDSESYQVLACLDSSELKVTDQGGHQVNSEDSTPTMNLFTMEEREGHWVLTDQTFPEELNCGD